MAEGTHHANGAPGILLGTIGPGLVNAVNTVVNAWQDQVPLLIISGCIDHGEAETYTHQVFDQSQLMRTVSKGSFVVTEKFRRRCNRQSHRAGQVRPAGTGSHRYSGISCRCRTTPQCAVYHA